MSVTIVDIENGWDSKESFWLNSFEQEVYLPKQLKDSNEIPTESVSYEINPTKSNPEGVFQVLHQQQQKLSLQNRITGSFFHFFSPKHETKFQKQLRSVDVSSDKQFVAVGGSDGFCSVISTSHEELQPAKEFVGHVDHVNRVQFFPSSKVLLTASSDFSLRIWSVEKQVSAATLKGHFGSVLGTAIVGRGRNIMSCGSDGKVLLWNCGTSSIIADWNFCVPVNSMALHKTVEIENRNTSTSSQQVEFETEGNYLLVGLENGVTKGIDVRSRAEVFSVSGIDPITACCIQSSNIMITGSDLGKITGWDVRNTKEVLFQFSRGDSSITSIRNNEDCDGIWVSSKSGYTTLWKGIPLFTASTPFVSAELTGPCYDPIWEFAVVEKQVWTVCRDNTLRKYSI